MTEAENRAAAKAYADEQVAKERADAHAAAVAADLEQLRRFRQHFLRERRVWTNVDTLIAAIDDQAERLSTGS